MKYPHEQKRLKRIYYSFVDDYLFVREGCSDEYIYKPGVVPVQAVRRVRSWYDKRKHKYKYEYYFEATEEYMNLPPNHRDPELCFGHTKSLKKIPSTIFMTKEKAYAAYLKARLKMLRGSVRSYQSKINELEDEAAHLRDRVLLFKSEMYELKRISKRSDLWRDLVFREVYFK